MTCGETAKTQEADAPTHEAGAIPAEATTLTASPALLKLAKADDFTDGTSPRGGEVRALQTWLIIVLVDVGVLPLAIGQAVVRTIRGGADSSLAHRNIRTGLRAEHFRSLLDNLPSDFDDEEVRLLSNLRAEYEATLDQFLALQETRPQEPDRPDPPDVRN